jgi:CBS domain containing-hemolysin-like protein
MQTILTILLALLTLLSVSLQRTYSRVPLKELKRRARSGDELAGAILKAVGFGHSLRAVLWFLIGITSAGFFVMVSASAPFWFALTASVMLVWVGFVLIPAARVTFISERLAAWCAPVLAKVLAFLHPVIDWLVRFIRRHRPVHVHTGLYDRRDLIDLLEQQQVQPDNRIEKAGLEIALHALTFGDDTVAEHMVPRRMVKAASADEPLGPVIMDELHSSGHSRFPVYEGKQDNVVGTLYLRDLVRTKQSGTVRSLMKPEVSYIHEDQSLQDALQAILRTHRQLFIVVNSFEEYVGIITIEDVLEAVIGSPIIDEFDQYDDLRAVAARAAKKEHAQHEKAILSEPIEVTSQEQDNDNPRAV